MPSPAKGIRPIRISTVISTQRLASIRTPSEAPAAYSTAIVTSALR